jgi:hypothetical protein
MIAEGRVGSGAASMNYRATITGDDLKRPVRVFETVDGNYDAVAIFLNEPLNAVLKLPIRFGSPFRRRIKDNRYRRRLLN